MKTKIQSLFMALLLVFAVLPAFTLGDVYYPTEPFVTADAKGKEPVTFWLYPGDQQKLESNLVLTYTGPSQKPTQMACTEELKLCSDGKTYVGRDSSRNCAFNACPGDLEMVNSISDSLAEGAEKTYVLQGDMAYAVEVMVIEDTTPATVTFNINGEVTNQLSPGKSVSLKNGVSILVHNIALRTASGDDFVKFTLGIDGSARATNSVDADKGVCEQFSMTFSTPAVLNKPRFVDDSKTDARYDAEAAKLKQEFEKQYNKYVAEGDEEKVIKLKEEFEEQMQALSKKYSIGTSDDVAYAYPEKEDSDASYTYPYDFEDFPEDKEVAKLKEEFERKYAKAVAEGDEEKVIKAKEEYLRKLDQLTKTSDETTDDPDYASDTKETTAAPAMRSETKTFCILPGEVGYPIILYEKKDDGVLVGYNAWKGENPSYYVAANGQARQTSYGSPQEKDSCQVEGNGAIPVGTRLNVEDKSQYCDALTKQMMVQKQDGEQAENDYECLSNEQNNGRCVNSLNILQKIWKGITSIFGF